MGEDDADSEHLRRVRRDVRRRRRDISRDISTHNYQSIDGSS
jgi:hypothetical protein